MQKTISISEKKKKKLSLTSYTKPTQSTNKWKLSPHLSVPIFPLLLSATVYRPLCMTGGFCPDMATCSRPFQALGLPYTPPSAPAVPHLLVSFRSQGLSYACCPTQSGPWQRRASLWNHTSQLFALASRHPTPTAPLFTPNFNGSFREREGKPGNNCGRVTSVQ